MRWIRGQRLDVFRGYCSLQWVVNLALLTYIVLGLVWVKLKVCPNVSMRVFYAIVMRRELALIDFICGGKCLLGKIIIKCINLM